MPENIGYQFNRLYAAPIETYRQVNTITNRNAIPPEIRWEGMECYVVTENQDYQLVGGVDNSNWVNAGETVSNPTTHFKGFFNATTVTPAISNLNGIEGDEYKVTNGGVNVDFGAGNVFLETDDIIIFYQSEWRVKVRPDSVGTLTANRALLSDASGKVDVSTVTSTELGYVSGVTSAIQTQLNAKLAASSYTAADVLTKIKTVDGSGSGLDADLLRGVHWGNVNTPITSISDITGRDFFSSRDGIGIVEIVGISTGCVVGTDTNHDLLLRRNNTERARLTSAGLSLNGTLIGNSSASFTGTATAAPATLSTELVTKGQLDAAARPYKVYTSLLSQSGTGDPTATVLENTLGGTITWARSSEGLYTATNSISGFTDNKTIVFINEGGYSSGDSTTINWVRLSGTQIMIRSVRGGAVNDGLLNIASFEIRVYP